MVGKEKVHLVNINISSRSLRGDAWSLLLLSGTRRPINPMLLRHNVFLSQSVLNPGGGNEVPLLKSAAVVLARSFNALHGSPLVLKLFPAVCVIAFAAWGLGLLICLNSIIVLHVFFLLTLSCRALDPVILPSKASHAVKQQLLKFVRLSLFMLAFAYCLSSLIQQAQKFFMDTTDTDTARNTGFSLAGKAVYAAVWVAAVVLFMELLGFPTQK